MGCPATGLQYILYRFEEGFTSCRVKVGHGATDGNGRSPGPILAGSDLKSGAYCLEFDAETYFKESRRELVEAFFGLVPINFRVTDPVRHYHVPLILSPFGYSTYRGS
jgi:5-hydroxyisourate hydrolase